MKKILFIFGTRPEAIKMAPLILKFQSSEKIHVEVCVTGQHREMLDQVLKIFNIKPDYDLNIMKAGQDLNEITQKILFGLSGILEKSSPDIIFVHGDTTTAFVSALSAFYKRISIAHIEAGLRTGDVMSPWPEEANRKLISAIAKFNFAPTLKAKENLLSEGVAENSILVTGNTVIDALHLVLDIIKNNNLSESLLRDFNFLKNGKPTILVTVHRRESFGDGVDSILLAIRKIAENNKINIAFPVHPNPNIRSKVFEKLGGVENIYLIDPQDYIPFVFLMNSSYLILTDSGGIQEEAPSLGTPVLVLRDVTERPEAIAAGTVKLVGTNMQMIIDEVENLLNNEEEYLRMSRAHNPYGDGNSSQKIFDFMEDV